MTLTEWVKKNKNLIQFYFRNHDTEVPKTVGDMIISVKHDAGLRNTAIQIGVKF